MLTKKKANFKFLCFLFTSIAVFSQVATAQAPKMVVVEEFTNASCPPCASQNPGFNELLEQNQGNVIPIKYQTQFPGYDPYNAQNNGDVVIRSEVYEITGVPTALIDGVLPDANYGGGIGKWATEGWYPGAPGGFNQEVLDYASTREAPLGLNIEAFWNEDLTKADVYVHITNLGTLPVEGFFRVPVLLVEIDNKWPFPPGGTQEVHFTHVMRAVYPVNGPPILNYLAPGADMTFEYLNLEIPDYIYDLKEMAFVTYIQNTRNLQILNGAITGHIDIPATFSDMAIREKRTVFSGQDCGKMAQLGMLVENSGSTEIQSFAAVFQFGDETYRYDIDMNLIPGDTVFVQAPEPVILPSGTHKITYFIENINGGNLREINLLNNLVTDDPFTAIAIRPTDAFELDFEHDKPGAVSTNKIRLNSPNNLFIRISEKSMFPNVTVPIGGYGASEKCVFANFRQWNTTSFNKRGSLNLLDNADISGMSDVQIIFDRAHAQRDKSGNLSNDVLEAHISYDCGQNWTLVYKKSGSDLATASPLTDRFFPDANQWATDTITLSELSAETLMFKFEIESDHGNSLLLDNFRVIKKFVNTEKVVEAISRLKLYPNPVKDKVFIDFELSKKAAVELRILTLEGKLVGHILHNEVLTPGLYQFEWEPVSEGLYLVSLNDGNQVINYKMTVIR